jgi:hypothetical protein
MLTPTRIEEANRFGAALNAPAQQVQLAPTARNRAAAAAFAVAQDHQAAIVLMLSNTLCSSSFALLRCLFEAYLRGLWLRHCATEDQVARIFRGEEPPKTIIAEIEATEAFRHGQLSRIKRSTWRALCSFTHTGGLHLQRWQSADAIEPVFSATEIEECLNFAELFGAMATLEMVQMSRSGDNGASVLVLMKSRWPETFTKRGSPNPV